MKRKALLIGNSNGLAGVKLDLSNYVKFLTSDFGGRWYNSEIVIKMNPTKKDILNTIATIKNENPDFAFVAFSGHGAYHRTTILELNKDGEYIFETDLIGISKRQITILDCCRNVVELSLTERFEKGGVIAFSDSQNNIRLRYERRIMQAIEQQIILYACSINESSLDTEEGGLYTKNLLGSSKPLNNVSYKLVGDTHEEAALKTRTFAWNSHRHIQNPAAVLPRCLTPLQLIFSINPNC